MKNRALLGFFLVFASIVTACSSKEKQIVYVDRPVQVPVQQPAPVVAAPVATADCYGADVSQNFNLQAASLVFQASPADIPAFVRAINDPSINRITTDGQTLHPLNVRRTNEGLLAVFDELCPQSANIATFGFQPSGSHYTMQVVGNPHYYHQNNLITAMVQMAAARAIVDALFMPSYGYWSRPMLVSSSPWFRTYRPMGAVAYQQQVVTRTRVIPSNYQGSPRLSSAPPAQTRNFAPPVAPVRPGNTGLNNTVAGAPARPIAPAQTASGIGSVKDGRFGNGTATAAPVTGGIMGAKPIGAPATAPAAPAYQRPQAAAAGAGYGGSSGGYKPTQQAPKNNTQSSPSKAPAPFKSSGSFKRK